MNIMINKLEKSKVYSSRDLKELGVNSYFCRILLESNELLPVKRGRYIRNGHDLDRILLMQASYPDAVFCLQSALYIHRYLHEEPEKLILAALKSESRLKYRSLTLPVICYYRDDKYARLGITEVDYRNKKVRATDRERTIIDCIRRKSLLSDSDYQSAIQGYINDPHKNITRLLAYAKQFRVEKKIRFIFDPWVKLTVEKSNYI